MRKTIAYVRVSSHDQKDGLERQKQMLGRQGWTFEVVADLGSGMNDHKKGLKRLLNEGRPVEMRIRAMMRGQRTEYRLKQRASISWHLAEERLAVAAGAKKRGITANTVRKWRRSLSRERHSGVEGCPTCGRADTLYRLATVPDLGHCLRQNGKLWVGWA